LGKCGAGKTISLISEVYGGGGNSGSYYKNDFVELYNPHSEDFSLEGWSIQYSAADSSAWKAIELSGILKSYGFYLIKLGQGSGGTAELPGFDVENNLNISATAGKVALVRTSDLILSSADENVVDYVSYGSTNDMQNKSSVFIGTAGNTNSVERKAFADSNKIMMGPGGTQEFGGNGWDTDVNQNDFILRLPDPQFSGSAIEVVYGW
jgi:trimeric autotransporter adhesin